MRTKRKKIKIELTQDQIVKLWPFFDEVQINERVMGLHGLAVMGQAWVKDDEPGRVKGWAEWTLLTAEETRAVVQLLKGEGSNS